MVENTTEAVTALEREIAQTYTTTTPSVERVKERNSGTVEIIFDGGPVSTVVAESAAPEWVETVELLAFGNGGVKVKYRKR